MSYVSSYKNDILIQKYAKTDSYYKNIKPTRKFNATDNNVNKNPLSRNTLDGYVKKLFGDVREGAVYAGMYYTDHIRFILDIYNKLLSTSLHYDVDILDVVFNSVIKDQPLDLAPAIYKEGDCVFLGVNLQRVMDYMISPQYKTSTKFIYMNLLIDINKLKHKNILIIDTVSSCIYRIEPHGSGSFTNPSLNRKINADLKKYINTSTTYFRYAGELIEYTKCPNTMRIQKNLRGGYCVTYSLFITYLLTRYDQTNLSKFLMGAHLDPRSYVYRFEHMSIMQQRYIFSHFLEKVFSIYYNKLLTYPNQKKLMNSRIGGSVLRSTNNIMKRFAVDIYKNKQTLLPKTFLKYIPPPNTYDPFNLAINYHPERNKHLLLDSKKTPSPKKNSPSKKRQKVKH